MRNYITTFLISSWLAFSGCSESQEQQLPKPYTQSTRSDEVFPKQERDKLYQTREKLFDMVLDPNVPERAKAHANVLIGDSIMVERDARRLSEMPYLRRR